jgi:hypothetical protein
MNSYPALKRIASSVLYYTALIIIVSGFSFFDLARTSVCWGTTINVQTTDNLQTLVNENPASTTFSLAPGIHRLQSVVPKNGDYFVGQTGAILSGAALLTTFTQSGSYWTAQVTVTQASSYPGQCDSTSTACIYPEDLFFNNVPKTRVTSLSSVGPGKWYLNYSTGTVYMGDDPAGYTVEMSELASAFTGGVSSVHISDLIIEKYASVAQVGAIQPTGANNYWAIEGNEIRYNHGRGITTGNGMYIANNNVHNNGQVGIGGSGANICIQGNQVSYNNYAGYNYYWEAGGMKFSTIQNLTVEYNSSHNNGGPGFWDDANSQDVTYSENEANGNIEAGILTEMGSNITISGNYIFNDGSNTSGSGPWWGAGILISDSATVSVYSNTLVNCMNGVVGLISPRGDAPNGQPYEVQNLTVDSNTITQTTGTAAGIAIDGTATAAMLAVYTSMNNTFQNNTYKLAVSGGGYFYWNGEFMTLASFLTYF